MDTCGPTSNKTYINNGWIYKANGNVDWYKARLVIKSYAQVHGMDFQEMFSIAAARKLRLRQFDIKTAFLYGDLVEDIYVKQPKVYGDLTQLVCKLQRAYVG